MPDSANAPTLSQLRHDLRTSLNHVLGYSEMMAEAATNTGRSDVTSLLHDIRTEAQTTLRLIETMSDEGSASTRLEVLQAHVRDPLHRMMRLSAALAQESDEQMLPDALRIGAAASKLLSGIALGSTAVTEVEKSETPAPDIPSPIPGARLLVVDDDDANREMLSRTLARQGYTVETAETGEEALSRMRRNGCDLVLLDIMMPGMDGCAVLAEMQKDPALAGIPAVMISAFDEVANVVTCIQSGAVDYLFKPFDPVLMRARLAATLERKRLLDAERARARELENLSSELRRSNEDLERFAYAVSHDLQTPLRTMVSFMQLVQRRLHEKLDEETERLIHDAVSAGKRMSDLIRDLLNYSQLSTKPLRTERVAVSDVVSEVLSDLKAVIEEAGAEVRTGEMPTVLADRGQLRQVFQNLISNAIKYRSERAPVVTISSERERDGWQFCVADNGVGIREEDISGIFQMFRRLHGPGIPGSGIGLATCQRSVERLSGTISVRSKPGEGSVFCFTIPARR